MATELWAESNLFCPNCTSASVTPWAAGTPAIDYTCPQCDESFQLKSQSRPFANRIVDAAYSTMRAAILADRTPNLVALHYEPREWRVQNLFLIPRFAFSLSVLERRNPLRPGARRAGWVGCNILLGRIPADARIPVVVDGSAVPPREVRRRYERLRPLAELHVEQRGWTLDVLNVVQSLGVRTFSLADVYGFEGELGRLHPTNRHIRDKIRQQLQILRDRRLLDFLGGGRYRLR